MKLLKSFRVLRLFRRIRALKKLLLSLGAALPGVTNALVVLLLTTAIFAILGVEFFSDVTDKFVDEDGDKQGNSCRFYFRNFGAMGDRLYREMYCVVHETLRCTPSVTVYATYCVV